MQPARASQPKVYLLGSYRVATALEPNSSRLTSLKSIRFDNSANNGSQQTSKVSPPQGSPRIAPAKHRLTQKKPVYRD